MQQLHFLSGLPRSGSTVLAALLNQNPEVFVTPTSPLLDVLNHVDQAWASIVQTHAWPDPHHKLNVSHGILMSMHSHLKQRVVIDKHRGWVKNVPGLTKVFGPPPKILCTVRDIAEIIASFTLLVNKAREQGKDNFVDQGLRERNWQPTSLNTSEVLWQNISDSYGGIRGTFTHFRSCLHLVEYKDLVSAPEKVIAGIYQFLDLPPFAHDYLNIRNTVEEDDSFWGLQDLHRIRPQLKRTSPHASEILGPEVFESFRASQLEFWR